ncbi:MULTISPECIES: glycosyltransferase [unclassified Acinetobacter]|uniref:glycosyltransferase family 2 protein n=1 Tax=unclassified Acinetobacter TaxID=196816 RepID=UPI002448DF8B|nr:MULTISPECIES: glycosyltransferase [unclassified Acinetobacter]MDH0032428.1 glycosyltransferase [Acinetobacter sp. GD04021]MDH0888041.1 glycosyltransferase [Acinetobacter sp. GD03873]MDH1084303.1 glycosyltransferase [Acinetobacter sp. GD03983]MDH2191335.1 glycosyltransferase [Acinetobacter sp. GD03645]MDH2204873.1 glycosyltransferase [Acinetobacter sp. GD03647]
MQSKSQPLVSIVIPCYNHSQYVQDCIQSVINQTYKNIELIIIDDGSKDNSIEKIEEMLSVCEERFTRFEFRYRANRGLSATLNEALEWCHGEYFSAIASDDMLLPEKLMVQVPILEADDACKGVFGNMILINDQNEKCGEIIKKEKKYFFKDLFKYTEYLPAPTQILRLKDIKDVNGFNEKFIIEDWYIYLKILEKGGYCIHLNYTFTKYRLHEDNLSKKKNIMIIGKLQIADYFKSHEREYNQLLVEIYLFAIINMFFFNPIMVLKTLSRKLIRKLNGML